ncbi:uncharacterized protein RHOBADRAFT_45272 [Rhodotorula graminis WP1]|uniref:Uncharacterized protein n=1 Tax=Rhodotorula graminis (strain WP1) TaxID=578459 RepID=A0A0P9GKR1_RHOGW|nr:uncharacterized protein RHOBADRAFT_45272 [Rhodotorula graminis WP1]KPV73979.1 hypothetical protein RHOBADRAFT_45272 [Rhodotorula graminis WP1]
MVDIGSQPRSLASRLFGRKPAPPVVEDDAKFDEKADDIDMLPELVNGLQAEVSYKFMAEHTYQMCLEKRWIKLSTENVDSVGIRLGKRRYITFPEDQRDAAFGEALNGLNCEIAVTYSADVVRVIVGALHPDLDSFSLDSVTQIQVVDDMSNLARARVAQHACFIRNERRLVIWADKVSELKDTVADLEAKLVDYVFNCTLRRGRPSRSTTQSSLTTLSTPRDPFQSSPSLTGITEEAFAEGEKGESLEDGIIPHDDRTLPLFHSAYTGLAVALNLTFCALLIRVGLYEYLLNGKNDYLRLCIIAAVPFLFFVILFFSENVLGIILQLVAPIGQMGRNSLHYSAVAPPRRYVGQLPHMTIMMPVYKESLDEVLAPTIESVSQAIRTYELQGGTASIIVCEDGMQLVDADEENRAGRFKKSSNLNVTHALSLRIEHLMDERRPTDVDSLAAWSLADEDRLYESAFAEALKEKDDIIWGNGNIRIGELILMIDSDTRVPRDCLLDAACEMQASPEVGVLQHCSGTFLAGAGFFENYISFFTTSVNYSITWAVANGSSSPFMGHNAFLRWSALQHQAQANPEGKIWSEEHVSEDFVMTLNLVRAGYITRWATYSKLGFEEGVSLSCDDELNRWQKYAFGCSEMVFQPFRYWFTRGPISKLFTSFLRGKSPLPCKLSSISYIASYWALAVACPMVLAFYFLEGEFIWDMSGAFRPAFSTLVSIIVVFAGGSTCATAVSRYRSQNATLRTALWQGFSNAPAAVLFFTGLSFHVMTALLAHVTSYNMVWSATKKDLEMPTIQEELPVVFKRHWLTFLLGFSVVAGAVIMTTSLIPLTWQIPEFTIIFPLLWLCGGHILYPLLLNPAIMLFRF